MRTIVYGCVAALIVMFAISTDAALARKKNKGGAIVMEVGKRRRLEYREITSLKADNPALVKIIKDRRRGGYILIPKRRGHTILRWKYKEPRTPKSFRGQWKLIVR